MIKVRDLWKRYAEVEVMKGLSVDIQDGEVLVVLGRSGVGKSVLLKHLIGLTKPDRGSIDIGGVRITDLSGPSLLESVRDMGMLFQGAALFDSMNIEENTAFHLKQHNKQTKAEIKERVDEALALVGLEGTQKKMPSDLSGGMKKRAALARLIVYRPKILLYDEPTTGLDPITAMHINELIVKIQGELKGTSIVVTHDIVSALFVGDRLALHKEGKIAYIDKPDEFIKIDDPEIKFLHKIISSDPRTLKYNHNNNKEP